MPWHWILFLVSCLSCIEGILGNELSSSSNLRKSLDSSGVRRKLSAATLDSQLRSRSQSLLGLFKQETVFHYLHEASDAVDDSMFAASLAVKSREPMLLVEELDTELKDIVCSSPKMSLFFNGPGAFDVVKESFELNNSLIIVTAHDGCNLDGERATYRANEAVVDAANYAVHIQVHRCEWQEAFIDMHVSFFRTHVQGNKIRRRTLERRQQSQVTTTTVALTGSGPTPTVSFPAVPSVTSKLPSTATETINVTLVDQVIFPPQVPLAAETLPQGITISCKNCSIGGSIQISEASFGVPDSDNPFGKVIDTVNETIQFFKHGSVTAVATGLFAHIELGVDISASQNLKSLSISLPPIPLSPFEIPGVVVFGPVIVPELDAGITLAESLSFTYGMNLSVPDNSKLEINMTELANSTVSGFDGTTVHTLPLESTSALVSLLLSVTFKPKILLAISTFTGSITGGIGGFLSLPTLTVNITELANVDQNCQTVLGSGAKGAVGSALDNILGNFTNIVPSVDLNVGALAEFELDVADFHETAATQVVLASTSYPLATACLNYDAKKQTYGTPTTAAASATATGAGSASRKNSGETLCPAGLRRLAAVFALLVSAGFCGWA